MAGFGRKRIDITPSEMMELRNQGYSNKDIAHMLDISHETVRKYIGKQGCRMGGLAAFEDKPKAKAVVASAESTIPPYVPTLLTEQYSIGKDENPIEVEIDHIVEMMRIERADGGSIDITFDEARELVRFLAWASDKCKHTKEEKSDEDNT